MATTKLYLDTRTVTNGLSPIKLTITHHGKSVHISLGIRVSASQWDKKACKIINHSQKHIYNNILQQRKAQADNIIITYANNNNVRTITAQDLKKIILNNGNLDNNSPILFMEYFRNYKNGKSGRTKEIYQVTENKLYKYTSEIDSLSFEDITKDWLTDFDRWLAVDCMRNSRNIHLRNIRAVFNSAIDNDITNYYPFRRFKIKPEATSKRSFSVEQLRQFFNYTPEPYAQRYIDLFKLMFYLCGINIADMCYLTEIVNGRIEYKRAKTHRLYSIKIEPEAMEIIEKYRGKKQLLDIMDTRSDYKSFTKIFNLQLKQIGEVQTKGRGGKKIRRPLFPQITSYWARHSWATIAAELDIPKETIAAALGHGGYSVTDIYINFNQKKIDEANRRVIDWVLYNKR